MNDRDRTAKRLRQARRAAIRWRNHTATAINLMDKAAYKIYWLRMQLGLSTEKPPSSPTVGHYLKEQ